MEHIQEKTTFLKNEFTKKIAGIDPSTKPIWGKMNLQQMIEHMGDYVRIASGKDIVTLVTPIENLPKMLAFMESEKPFRENTPNPLLPDTPPPPKMTVKDAIDRLQNEIDDLFVIFEKEPGKRTMNPFFGELNLEQNIQLLHKHGTHHLRQFGAM